METHAKKDRKQETSRERKREREGVCGPASLSPGGNGLRFHGDIPLNTLMIGKYGPRQVRGALTSFLWLGSGVTMEFQVVSSFLRFGKGWLSNVQGKPAPVRWLMSAHSGTC